MQAVVLIHGMGEQRPIDTVKGFVGTVWERDPSITANGLPNAAKVWSKPDDRTGSLELRRITTRESIPGGAYPAGVRTDFGELYWADLSAGSTWEQFVGWIRYLLLRRPSRVPRDVRGAWVLLIVASILVVLVGGLGFLSESLWRGHAPAWLDQKLAVARPRTLSPLAPSAAWRATRGPTRTTSRRGRRSARGGSNCCGRSTRTVAIPAWCWSAIASAPSWPMTSSATSGPNGSGRAR